MTLESTLVPSHSSQRFKITIEYDGTPYVGWQRQPGLKSVQGEIEAAIQSFCGQTTDVYGSGRTDAGVHALGQVAHFDLELPLSINLDDPGKATYQITRALNHFLRDQPICILKTELVSHEFHARFSAIRRSYIYKLVSRPQPLALDRNRAAYTWEPLALAPMQEASKYLIGNHDFSSFRASACQSKSPVKTLDDIYITQEETLFSFYLTAPSFLHHQVRNIVGTLMLVATGKWMPHDVKTALEARDRSAGGPTADASGLYFHKIFY